MVLGGALGRVTLSDPGRPSSCPPEPSPTIYWDLTRLSPGRGPLCLVIHCLPTTLCGGHSYLHVTAEETEDPRVSHLTQSHTADWGEAGMQAPT